jgi:hypothetical protein
MSSLRPLAIAATPGGLEQYQGRLVQVVPSKLEE